MNSIEYKPNCYSKSRCCLSWQQGCNFSSDTTVVIKGISRKSCVVYRSDHIGRVSLWCSPLVHNFYVTAACLKIKIFRTLLEKLVSGQSLWVWLCPHLLTPCSNTQGSTFPFLFFYRMLLWEWITGLKKEAFWDISPVWGSETIGTLSPLISHSHTLSEGGTAHLLTGGILLEQLRVLVPRGKVTGSGNSYCRSFMIANCPLWRPGYGVQGMDGYWWG